MRLSGSFSIYRSKIELDLQIILLWVTMYIHCMLHLLFFYNKSLLRKIATKVVVVQPGHTS